MHELTRNKRLHRSPEISDMPEPAKKQPTVEEKMDQWGAKMDAMCSQMDAWMAANAKPKKDAKTRADDDEGEGEVEPMASDDNRADEGTDDPSTTIEDRLPPYARRKGDAVREEELHADQARADQVAQHWGRRAVHLRDGDTLHSYRVRSGNAEKQFSKKYRAVDLNEIRDPRALKIAVDEIRADSIEASSNPTTPRARLQEIITTDRTGRQISTFMGPVSETLAPFRLPVMRVTHFNKSSGNGYIA
jgi:hypothetical protein